MFNIADLNPGELIQKILIFILSPFQHGWMDSLRFSFLVVSLILAAYLIYLLSKNTWLKRLFIEDYIELWTWKAYGIRSHEKAWRKIKDRLLTRNEHECKMAIMEADNMLSETLSKMEYGSKADIETLNTLPVSIFPNIEDVKWAHSLNESIAHDPDYRLSMEDAKKALDAYEKFFIDLEIL